jgi:hypothetical protein
MTNAEFETDAADTAPCGRLTHEEDSELRRLNYLAKLGQLSQRATERFLELRIRDRRTEIREPREFDTPVVPANQRRWIERLLRTGS